MYPYKLQILFLIIDFVDVQYLLGSSSHYAAIVYGFKNWRSWDYHFSLFVCSGILQSIIYIELDLSLLYRRFPWFNCNCCWNCPDHFVLRLLLFVYNQRYSICINCCILIKIDIHIFFIFNYVHYLNLKATKYD